MTVQFKEWKCDIVWNKYADNGRTAIELVDADTGEPIARATTNLPHIGLGKDEVMIKDYSENEGMVDALADAGIIALPDAFVQSGFVKVPICRLRVTPEYAT
jgi:hypothetical protein